ncbi:hypothetical protein PoB_003981300 [Plakobranchus ocellatus]|uniref:Uncharacterized protein n=1 Tax=Plakobranchus ocellatus TaxID=259542 RepID=A0AAV4B2G1_9GAST|nr:hypothetical protein PoB_003981300 [Plakobranchus ocellatus]
MPASTFVSGSIDMQVRFESMGGNARRAQIFRRHEDLQRSYEHQVKMFARETRHVTSKLSRIQSEHINRMKAIQSLEPQTFPEEWPPLEERRAIAAQMQDALPLLTGAVPMANGSNSKHKNKNLKKNKVTLNSDNAVTIKSKTSPQNLNGMLGQPHWAHPRANALLSQKAKGETDTLIHRPPIDMLTVGHSATQPQASLEHGQPAIILSPSQQSDPGTKTHLASNNQTDVSLNSNRSAPAIVLHQPNQLAHQKHHAREKTGTTSSTMHTPRRKPRARQPWGKHEDVLLFRIETRDGKETYTQVARRKYPSII